MKIVFTQDHLLAETRTPYKKGDVLNVHADIAKRLKDEGLAKDAESKEKTKKEEPKTSTK